MYTSPLLAGPYRPASCRNEAHSNSSRSRDPACVGEALGDQILAHSVAPHVTVNLAGSRAQRLERRGLGLGAGQLVRAPAGAPAYVLPCERRTVLGSAWATCRPGLSARSARHTRPPYSTARRY